VWQTGIFSDQSLFQKVIASTLQPQQIAKYQHEEAARNSARYQAKIKLAIISLDNVLGLTDAQRQELEKLLSQTPPPKKFGQYDHYYVFTQVAKLPNEKLKSILDARQLKLIQPIIQRNKGFEQMLKQQGVM
jgi:deoxyadenosine/deoxycytidine kinase